MRLPTNLSPYLYEHEIKPYIGPQSQFGDKAFIFEGHMKMHLTCVQPTNQIIFHMVDFDVDETSLQIESVDDSGIKLQGKYEIDEAREFFKMNFTKQFIANKNYTFTIKYEGPLRTELYGFYRSSYVSNGERK